MSPSKGECRVVTEKWRCPSAPRASGLRHWFLSALWALSLFPFSKPSHTVTLVLLSIKYIWSDFYNLIIICQHLENACFHLMALHYYNSVSGPSIAVTSFKVHKYDMMCARKWKWDSFWHRVEPVTFWMWQYDCIWNILNTVFHQKSKVWHDGLQCGITL